jgi:hypothetical protein
MIVALSYYNTLFIRESVRILRYGDVHVEHVLPEKVQITLDFRPLSLRLISWQRFELLWYERLEYNGNRV